MHTYPLAEYMAHVEASRWHEAGELLLSSANVLVRAGAELLICPDNTLHQALDLVRERTPAPWLHIVEEVAAVAVARWFQAPRRAWNAVPHGGSVYRDKLAASGIACEILTPGNRERINAIIFDELVYGRLEETARSYFRGMIAALGARGCDAVILGCTRFRCSSPKLTRRCQSSIRPHAGARRHPGGDSNRLTSGKHRYARRAGGHGVRLSGRRWWPRLGLLSAWSSRPTPWRGWPNWRRR